MNMHGLRIGLILWMIPLCASAGWEVVKPSSAIPREPFFQAQPQAQAQPLTRPSPLPPKNPTLLPTAYGSAAFPNQYAHFGPPAPVYAVSISGSLKENIERIMSRYHWKVVWKAPYDYNFDGRVTGSSLPNVVEKLLKPFPLQAVMYMSNRTLMVQPRYRT